MTAMASLPHIGNSGLNHGLQESGLMFVVWMVGRGSVLRYGGCLAALKRLLIAAKLVHPGGNKSHRWPELKFVSQQVKPFLFQPIDNGFWNCYFVTFWKVGQDYPGVPIQGNSFLGITVSLHVTFSFPLCPQSPLELFPLPGWQPFFAPVGHALDIPVFNHGKIFTGLPVIILIRFRRPFLYYSGRENPGCGWVKKYKDETLKDPHTGHFISHWNQYESSLLDSLSLQPCSIILRIRYLPWQGWQKLPRSLGVPQVEQVVAAHSRHHGPSTQFLPLQIAKLPHVLWDITNLWLLGLSLINDRNL